MTPKIRLSSRRCVWDVRCKWRSIAHTMLTGIEKTVSEKYTQRSQVLSGVSAGKRSYYIFKNIHTLTEMAPVCTCVLRGRQHLCVCVWRSFCSSCVWPFFHVLQKKEESFLKISTLLNCLRLSKRQAGIRWVNMSTVYNYSPSAQRLHRSSPGMIHKWITVFRDKEIISACLFRERGSTVVSYKKRCHLFCFFFSVRKVSMDAPSRQWNIWLHGSVAPHEQRHTWDTHKPTYVTLAMAFCVTRWIIYASRAEGIHHYT